MDLSQEKDMIPMSQRHKKSNSSLMVVNKHVEGIRTNSGIRRAILGNYEPNRVDF